MSPILLIGCACNTMQKLVVIREGDVIASEDLNYPCPW